MPIDAEQWRAHTGLVGASRLRRTSTRHKRPKVLTRSLTPFTLSLMGVRIKKALGNAVTYLIQALCLILVIAYQTPRVLSFTASHTVRFLSFISSRLLFAISSYTVQLLSFTSSSVLRFLNVITRWSQKGLKSVSILLALCLVVVQMLLLMSGDVERNPGPPNRLCSDDLVIVRRELRNVCCRWYDIGLELNIHHGNLDTIKYDNPSDASTCLREMLCRWLTRVDPVPTWESLAEALESAVINENDLAKQLRMKYCEMDPESEETKSIKPCPDFITKYEKFLKAKYCKLSVIPDETWRGYSPKFKHDTEVALIEYQTEPGPENFADDMLRGNIDRIAGSKKNIDIHRIFDPPIESTEPEGFSPLKILIDGAPGIGKSTLTRRFVKDWAEGKLLKQYSLVLLLPLREKRVFKAGSIDDFFYHDDSELQREVVRYIRQESGKNVMLIFDGFDELNFEQREEDSLFLDVISGDQLPMCSVVITSRPYASGSLRCRSCIDRHVEIIGFTRKKIEAYIQDNFNDRMQANNLIQALKDRQDIISLCYIPLNCSIITSVYTWQGFTLPDTLTQLYEMFLTNIIKRHMTKKIPSMKQTIRCLNDLPSGVKKCLDGLSKLAYEALLKETSIFELDELTSELSQVPDAAFHSKLLGLMTVHQSMTGFGPEENYQFLHLTVQEFLAARHASQLPIDEQVAFYDDPNWVFSSHLKVMLLFLAGISKFDNQKYREKLTGVDMYFYNPEDDDPMDFRGVACVLLQYVHAIYESQNFAMYRALADCVQEQEICMNSIDLSPFHCRMLAYFLTHSCHPWKRLEMVNCSLTDSCLQAFSIKTSVDSTNINSACIKCLILSRCEVVQGYQFSNRANVFSFHGISLITNIPLFQSLEILEVSFFPVVPKHCLASSKGFAQVLQMKHLRQLKFCELPIQQFELNIRLMTNTVDYEDVIPCKLLEKPQPVSHTLQELLLSTSHNEPFESEIECIAATLQNSKIEKLHLEPRNCSTSCLQRLFYQLQYVQNLRELSLTLMRTYPQFYNRQTNVYINQYELEGLQYMLMMNSPLECLTLQIDVIIDGDIDCIAKGLSTNTSLKQLNIFATKECPIRLLPLLVAIKQKGNLEDFSLIFPPCMFEYKTEEDGLVAITQVLQSSRCLRILSLAHSIILPLEIAHLAAGLTSHPSLRYLYLHLSEIQLDSALLLFKAIGTCSQLSLQQVHIEGNMITQYPHDELKDACQVSSYIQTVLLKSQTVMKIDFCSCLFEPSDSIKIHPKLLPFLQPMVRPIFDSLAIKYSSLQYCGILKLELCNATIVALFEFRAVEGGNQENTSPAPPPCKRKKREVPDHENPVESTSLLPMRWESLSCKASFEAIKNEQNARNHDSDSAVKDCMAYIGVNLVIGQSKIIWLHQIEFGKCWTTSSDFSRDVAIPGPGDDPFLI